MLICIFAHSLKPIIKRETLVYPVVAGVGQAVIEAEEIALDAYIELAVTRLALLGEVVGAGNFFEFEGTQAGYFIEEEP